MALIVIRPSVLYICSEINCRNEVCLEIFKIVQSTVNVFIGFKEEESHLCVCSTTNLNILPVKLILKFGTLFIFMLGLH